MRTIQECLQPVLWNGMSALAPLNQALPPGLATVQVNDRPPSQLVVAWNRTSTSPLIRSFVRIAADSYRSGVSQVLDGLIDLDPAPGRPARSSQPGRGGARPRVEASICVSERT